MLVRIFVISFGLCVHARKLFNEEEEVHGRALQDALGSGDEGSGEGSPREAHEGSGEYEDAEDVCNVYGSTCPPDKCCRDYICDREGYGQKCCDDPTIEPDHSNPECANCPKCIDCEWSAWSDCKNLKCDKGGKEPETGNGTRTRYIAREAKHGGRQCSGGSCSLEDFLQACTGNCPGCHCIGGTHLGSTCGDPRLPSGYMVGSNWCYIQSTGSWHDAIARCSDALQGNVHGFEHLFWSKQACQDKCPLLGNSNLDNGYANCGDMLPCPHNMSNTCSNSSVFDTNCNEENCCTSNESVNCTEANTHNKRCEMTNGSYGSCCKHLDFTKYQTVSFKAECLTPCGKNDSPCQKGTFYNPKCKGHKDLRRESSLKTLKKLYSYFNETNDTFRCTECCVTTIDLHASCTNFREKYNCDQTAFASSYLASPLAESNNPSGSLFGYILLNTTYVNSTCVGDLPRNRDACGCMRAAKLKEACPLSCNAPLPAELVYVSNEVTFREVIKPALSVYY